ncbi:MAG: chromosomal replication initiator protein DnaA [Alphaproteobacteria bacterium]|nr:MAG: chromosomal replication initiator protein DnaA [Alphaproteobacteria bacterium]
MEESPSGPQGTLGRETIAAVGRHAASDPWKWVRAQLRREYGRAQYERWLAPLRLVAIEDGLAELAVPTEFIREWIERNYLDRIRALMAASPAAVEEIRLKVAGEQASAEHVSPRPGHRNGKGANGARGSAPDADGQVGRIEAKPAGTDSFGGRLEPRYRFESFIVGKSNAFAHAAARRVAESEEVPFNPLFLHGGVGLGKTHLMHAIAWEFMRNFPDKKVMYISAEKFMYQFIAAVRYRDTMSFKQQFRSVDLLMLDDVQFIANKDSTQEEFFHTFNALIESQKQLVISADRSPTDLEGIQERIVSRLGWGLVADIHPTDYELRYGILQAKAEAVPDVVIPNEVLDFLARKITSNVRELEGALNRVVAFAQLVGRAVTLDLVREVLSDLLRANDRKITIDEIQRVVADYYNLRISELLSPRRSRNIARPRQVAMYLAKQLTARSLPEIGRKFSGRDHTTVIHAVRKIEDLRKADSTLDEDIHRLMRQLQS